MNGVGGWLCLWVCGLCGCFPEPVSVVGKLCDATRGCGDGHHCIAGRCLADAASEENLLPNPGFESGLIGWSSTGTLVQAFPGHDSATAAAISGGGGSPLLHRDSSPVTNTRSGFYCATAWVRGPPLAHGATLRLYEADAPEDAETGEVDLDPTQWRQLKVSFHAGTGSVLELELVSGTSEELKIDDLRLWPAENFQCDEP